MPPAPAVHDLDATACCNGEIVVGIGIERAELQSRGLARQGEAQWFAEDSSAAVVEQQFGAGARKNTDSQVRPPVICSKLSGGGGRDHARKPDTVRAAEAAATVAGEEVEAVAVCCSEHVRDPV